MFDVISTAKNTQWLSFPSLCSKYSYSHVDDEAVDFQVVPGKNCFAEFNKKFGFEVLRTTNKENKEVIQRIKKRQLDDLSCGAISKLCGSEIAIGMTTGYIRIFSVQTGEYMPIKFKPDRIRNSVVDVDYSKNDEYLVAVYDSSNINLFSLKSSAKTDTFKFDGLSTLVRFHPAREFTLAIGSYEGGVTIFDIQTKKKLFFDKSAHDAPVRDISMFDSQDLFASCGYDSKINVYDLRLRAMVQQHKQAHPMSTVCVSSCGTICVAGNLKGDVTAYDFRNMREPLNTKRVHDSAVVRVAFVPSVATNSNTTHDSYLSANSEMVTSLYKSASTASSASMSRRSSSLESFSKYVEVSHQSNATIAEASTPTRRDSWGDLMQGRKVHDFSMDSVAETPSRMSIVGDFHSDSQLNWQSRFSLNSDQGSNGHKSQADSTISAVSETNVVKSTDKKDRPVIEPKRRRMTEIMALEGIEEEVSEMDKSDELTNKKLLHTVNHKEFADGFAAYVKRVFDDNVVTSPKGDGPVKQQEFAHNEEDKENRQNNDQNEKMFKNLAQSITHTPSRHTSDTENANGELILVNTNELNEMFGEIIKEKMVALEAEFESHVRNWQENVTTYMSSKLKELTAQVRYMQGRYFHSDFNNRYRNHMELENELDMFDEGFAALLHTNTVEEQYPNYSAELEDLRRRFQEQQKFNR